VGILLTDTTLRDAHQSLIATRMRTRDMLPIVTRLDAAGFFSLEVWGGATYDSCIRFLDEDPWDRLKEIRARAKNTRLQMLLRGQNLVGYRHYADDVVREFIRLSVKNGVDVFRIFDALNDIRNMSASIKFAREFKAHVQGTICYTTSPVHTIARFVAMAEELAGLGCDSICIKDMAGLITPAAAGQLVAAIKKRVNLPLDLHSHCSSGMAPLSYYAAVTAGVDILDTAFSAFSWGTSQPPTESIAAAFKDTPYDTGLDLQLLYEIGEFFNTLAEKYAPLLSPEVTRTNINVLLHQIPGGMVSNLVSQLREQNALDRLGEVIEEIPRVRADLGYPPLVTPTSQLVGIQAVLNVLTRQRYKQITQEIKNYLLGHYGQAPGEVNEEIRSLVTGTEKPISVRPADLIAPELARVASDGRKIGIIHKEEDVLTYVLYPQVAVKFLRGELNEEKMPVKATAAAAAPAAINFPLAFSVDVDGEVFDVKVSSVTSKTIEVEREKKQPRERPVGAITAPVQGMLQSIKVKIGAHVEKGAVLAVIEAMKMQNEVTAAVGGMVTEILAYESELVNNGDVILVVKPDDR
jgi:pyruvate carboxylase subunit B